MMKRTLFIICIGILIAIFAGCGAEEKKGTQDSDSTVAESTTTTPSGVTIRIAAFNIQVFGKSKRGKPEVMDILARIAREFDVFLGTVYKHHLLL